MEADLIIKNVWIFNAYLKKFIFGDAAILNGKFLHIKKGCSEYIKSSKVIDGGGKYLIPGLIDIHLHIESSMTTPLQFAQTVLKYGITTVVAEPHEIANVFGIEGIEAMIAVECGDLTDIFYGIPSSVPSTSFKFETTGGSIGVEEVSRLIKNKHIICLGEVMNLKELIGNGNSRINKIINLIKEKDPHFVIEGHCPRITGIELSKCISKGVDSDHTQQTVSSLREKISNGMFIEMQEKSITEQNIQYLAQNNLYEHFCFVTDDVMADKLVKGHLDRLIRKAISMGMPPEMAVYTSTYTPSKRMKLNDRGVIAPGKIADFLIVDNMKNFKINSVYKNGKRIGSADDFKNHLKNFPEYFYHSVKMNRVSLGDFNITTPVESGDIKCRIIKVRSDTTFTREIFDTLKVAHHKLLWEDDNSPYCLIGVFERYGKNKNKAFGLVGGDIIKKGAVAATYVHDHHNLMVMGKSPKDMVEAANFVIENQGGYCVVEDGKIIVSLELPVGGILSEEPVAETGRKLKNVRDAMKHLGYKHNNEIMSFSTLGLPVSPELKITDKGLIEVKEQKIVKLFCEH